MRKTKTISSFLSYLFFCFIILSPSFVLLSSTYWKAIIQNSPFFIIIAIATLFLFPILIFIGNPKYNNPFFYLPFTCSFVFTSFSLNFDFFTFLRNYLLIIGLILTILGLFRTKRPFILLEIQLYLTTFFMDFFEVKLFWRTLVIVLCYNLIPFALFFSLLYR